MTFYRYECYYVSHRRGQKGYFLFLRFKIAKLSSQSQNRVETECCPQIGCFFYFSKVNLGSSQKNGGLHPYSFHFWVYLAWDPSPSWSPKPAAGSHRASSRVATTTAGGRLGDRHMRGGGHRPGLVDAVHLGPADGGVTEDRGQVVWSIKEELTVSG